MRRYLWIVVLAFAATGFFARLIVVLHNGNEITTAAHFDALQADHSRMRAFLRRMPKEGDLHTHLSGAVYAKRYVAWAVRDGLCLRRSDMTLMAPPGGAAQGHPCGADPSAIPVSDAVSGRNGQTNFRFIAQINRNSAPAEVFAQTALATALVRKAPHIVVGINDVGPEDYRISLRDYRTHMRWIRFLARDDVPVALHAGTLWMGLVPPPDLAFHIRDAVETAGARRIGHGTAVVFERDMDGLLAEMRRRGVTIEIALTSSDVTLGVRG